MAGLNFVGNASYQKPQEDHDNIAQFEFIPWILSQCVSVKEARVRLAQMVLTDTPFNEQFAPAQLHWILADKMNASSSSRWRMDCISTTIRWAS